MSRETLNHLNTNTLIGFTDNRGNAWHYRAEEQGEETNHYPGAIPIEDVRRRLFAWQAESRPIAVQVPAAYEVSTHLDLDGSPVTWERIEGRQAIVRSDNDHVMGIFTPGYVMHQFDQWLLTTVADLLDDDLAISSAGLLRNGAIAWTEISVPDTITTPEGVDFRPNLLATTSFDGSIATTYKRTFTATVCDNTRDLALAEGGQQVKVKHSRYSVTRLVHAREALALIHTMAEEFAAEVAELSAATVSSAQWDRFLDAHVPRRDGDGRVLTGRALTMADRKRDSLATLYRADARVNPWSGTALGVMQAVNTYEHHDSIVRGSTRAERNMLRAVTGDYADLDRTTWRTLSSVLN